MDVIISAAVSRRMVYHRPNCMYVQKIKPQNKMILSQQKARNLKYHSCKYCSGLKGEMLANNQFSSLERKYKVSVDYVKKSDTLYVRTEIGCWKIFFKKEFKKYLLYHRNTYSKEMTLKQASGGDYHRQGDVKPTTSVPQLIHYIAAHDKAKMIIMEDYRKLPKSTAQQRKYYRQAENRVKRSERKRTQLRIDQLFRSIEEKDPSMCKLAFC